MPFTVEEIAMHLQGEVIGDGSITLTGFAPADRARAGDLTFAESEKFFAAAEGSAASAIIADGQFPASGKTLIRVRNARAGFAKALALFFPEPAFMPGVHPSAVVASTAQIAATAHIGPHCVVGERAKIGERSVLQGGNHVGADCKMGDDVNLFPNVTVYARTEIGHRARIHSGSVIGSDGFGYVLDAGAHRKVPQVGNVIIGDDVEIGACVAIDRGALGPTVIGKGTKIDNLVQIAHNVRIGEHSIIIGQVGIAGSTKIGSYAVLAGQVGIGGHLKIGNRVMVGAKAGVMHDIPDGGKWLGVPAQPDRLIKRQMIAIQHLPDALKRIAAIEKKLDHNPRAPGENPPPEPK